MIYNKIFTEEKQSTNLNAISDVLYSETILQHLITSQIGLLQYILLCRSVKSCGLNEFYSCSDFKLKQDQVLCILKKAKIHLNYSQHEAIIKSLLSPISIIHGPPGTGKTFTCAVLIYIILCLQEENGQNGGRLYITAHTNAAIDELLRKLTLILPHDIILRIGDDGKCSKDLIQYCFSTKVQVTGDRLSVLNASKVIVGSIFPS